MTASRLGKGLILSALLLSLAAAESLKADTLESQHWPVLSAAQLDALINTISGEKALDHIRYITQYWRWAPSRGFRHEPGRGRGGAALSDAAVGSSFDNHVFDRGLLTLDERISETTRQTLQQRGHKVNLVPPSNSGAAPVAIRYLPGGVIEAGADPYIYRYAVAW